MPPKDLQKDRNLIVSSNLKSNDMYSNQPQSNSPNPAVSSDHHVRMYMNEKERLLEAVAKNRKEMEEIKRYIDEKKSTSGKPSTIVDQITEQEKEIKFIDDNNDMKRLKIEKLKKKLREKLEGKRQALEDLEVLRKQIMSNKQYNGELTKLVEEKKEMMLSLTMNLNDNMKKTIISNNDIRLTKLIGNQMDRFQNNYNDIPQIKVSDVSRNVKEIKSGEREQGAKLTYCVGDVKLHSDNLPKEWKLLKNEEDIIRLKFLTLRKQGICYEDEYVKVALKYKDSKENEADFSLRVINIMSSRKLFEISFTNMRNYLIIESEQKMSNLEKNSHIQIDFKIVDAPVNSLPIMQIKITEPDQDNSILINVTLPISLNWFFPLIILSKQQFDYLWTKNPGHFLQSELREMDNTIITSGNDITSLVPQMAHYPSSPHDPPSTASMTTTHIAGVMMKGKICPMKMITTNSNMMYIEMIISDKKQEKTGVSFINLYLYALSMFRYSVPSSHI